MKSIKVIYNDGDGFSRQLELDTKGKVSTEAVDGLVHIFDEKASLIVLNIDNFVAVLRIGEEE